MTFHSKASLGVRHPPHNWQYADATARLAATGFTVDDVGKEAWQLDNDTYWRLTDESPITWVQLGGGAPAAHASTHEDGGGDEIDVADLSGRLADDQPPWSDDGGTLKRLADGVGIKLYDSAGTSWVTLIKSGGNWAWSAGGVDANAAYFNAKIHQVQLAGLTSAQFSAISDSGDGNLFKVRADGVIVFSRGSSVWNLYPSSASDPSDSSPPVGSRYFNTATGTWRAYDGSWRSDSEIFRCAVGQFFDDFFGSDLGSQWVGTVSGTGSAVDKIAAQGGQVRVRAGAASGRYGQLWWSLYGLVNADVIDLRIRAKLVATTSVNVEIGLVPSFLGTVTFRYNTSLDSTWKTVTGDGIPSNEVQDTGVSPDTNWHEFRIVTAASSVKFYFDGVLKTTHATHIVGGGLAPSVKCTATAASIRDTLVDYVHITSPRAA